MFERIRWVESALSRLSLPWVRQVQTAIDDLRQAAYRRDQGELNANKAQTGTGKTQGDTIRELQGVVKALPRPAGYYVKIENFGLGSEASVSQRVPVPEGKTKVVLTAIGNVAVLDMNSGGVAVAEAKITASGFGFSLSSPTVYASKDAGASRVNNIISPSFGFERAGFDINSADFTVTLTIKASNPSAFPQNSGNVATLTLTAIFFD